MNPLYPTSDYGVDRAMVLFRIVVWRLEDFGIACQGGPADESKP